MGAAETQSKQAEPAPKAKPSTAIAQSPPFGDLIKQASQGASVQTLAALHALNLRYEELQLAAERQSDKLPVTLLDRIRSL